MSVGDGPAAAAGWFADPNDPRRLRYWDGHAWTEHVHPVSPSSGFATAGYETQQAPSGSAGSWGNPPWGAVGAAPPVHLGTPVAANPGPSANKVVLIVVGVLVAVVGLGVLVVFVAGGVVATTAIDNGNSAEISACQIEGRTVRTAAIVYLEQYGEPPLALSDLVGEYLKEDPTDWEINGNLITIAPDATFSESVAEQCSDGLGPLTVP